jgi:superfamily II DNA/RNA helicase
MYVDLSCGKCESSMALDTSDEEMETFSLDLIHRFTKAHEDCGFIAPTAIQSPNTKTVRPFKSDDTV